MKKIFALLIIFFPCLLYAQSEQSLKDAVAKLSEQNMDLNHRLDALQKSVDDGLWFNRLGDVAFIDKVLLCGPLHKYVTIHY